MTKRVKGKISRWICGGAALSLLFVVGGIERFMLSIGAGITLIIVLMAVILISAMKGGLIR